MMANTNTIQPPRHMNLEHSKIIREKGSITKDKLEHNKHSQETFQSMIRMDKQKTGETLLL